MVKELEYIELDRVFMNHVAYCGDRYQDKDSFLNEEIKNNFQKVLDKVKPKKQFIRCSEEDYIKYKLDFNRDISNTLDYEKCYTVLLDYVKDKTTDEKVSFLLPYVPYLRGMLQRGSAVLDNEDAYERYLKNETIAFLLVYRYEHKISILDDLQMEQTRDAVDEYDYFLSGKIAKERVHRELDFERNHPEEYKKMMKERERVFYEDLERLKKIAEKNGIIIKWNHN